MREEVNTCRSCPLILKCMAGRIPFVFRIETCPYCNYREVYSKVYFGRGVYEYFGIPRPRLPLGFQCSKFEGYISSTCNPCQEILSHMMEIIGPIKKSLIREIYARRHL